MVVFVLKYKDRIPKKVLNNLFGVIILNLLIGFNLQGIDNFGHIGGLLAGALVAFLFLMQKTRNEAKKIIKITKRWLKNEKFFSKN